KRFKFKTLAILPARTAHLARRTANGKQQPIPNRWTPVREVFSEMPGFPVLPALAHSRELTMTDFPREGATSKSPCGIGRIRPRSYFRRKCFALKSQTS